MRRMVRSSAHFDRCAFVGAPQAAARVSGITRIIFSARKEKVAGKYFMFPASELEDFGAAFKQPLRYIGGVDRKRALRLQEDGQE